MQLPILTPPSPGSSATLPLSGAAAPPAPLLALRSLLGVMVFALGLSPPCNPLLVFTPFPLYSFSLPPWA